MHSSGRTYYPHIRWWFNVATWLWRIHLACLCQCLYHIWKPTVNLLMPMATTGFVEVCCSGILHAWHLKFLHKMSTMCDQTEIITYLQFQGYIVSIPTISGFIKLYFIKYQPKLKIWKMQAVEFDVRLFNIPLQDVQHMCYWKFPFYPGGIHKCCSWWICLNLFFKQIFSLFQTELCSDTWIQLRIKEAMTRPKMNTC